ncbi:MAG: response regulator, partial [Thermoanaerobaculia bacterium]|nr:response regulator [Thermoanaerobaculia bacterium]
IGFSSILKETLSDKIESRHDNFLGNILRSSEHLLSLINDLLDLSKIEAGRMEVTPEPFPVDESLRGVREIMRGQTQMRNIEIEIDVEDGLPLLNADAAKFKQIIFNLLSNAVKFSPEGSTVSVRASTVPLEKSKIGAPAIRVDVRDRGIGIAPHDQEIIFQEFRQAEDGFVRQYGGTGLGLTLVRRFLEIQGGAITVDSELGVGSTFTVHIPQKVRPVTFTGDESDSDEARREEKIDLRPKILIVEDDPIAYVNLSAILHQEGYATIRARTGEIVRPVLEKERPVAIALDLMLPGLDGWEVLKDLKSDPELNHIPIVVVTMQENRELGLALGADDFFVKPVDPDQFASRVNELVAEKRRSGTTTVLLIDDDPNVHEIIRDTIRPLEYRFIAARNGEEGLHRARSERPDLIILDLLMPRLNGFETLDYLHHDPITHDTPVIILTEKELSEKERESIEHQILGLFSKHPKAREEFIERLHELLERRSSTQTAAGSE